LRAPRDLFRCKPEFEGDENNYIFIMVMDDPAQKMWKAFCDTIEHPEIFDDPRFIDGPTRFHHRDELKEIIQDWTLRHTKQEAMKILCEAKQIAGAVLTTSDVIKAEDMYESGVLYNMDHPYLGQMVVHGSPYHMSDSYVAPTAARDLGEDNNEVYKQLLGFDEAKIEELKAKGVL
ncbi:MAG: CoA transferase, partial [Clostridia bacterium]|nr:CoA transferase [Clostridia bacterium]